MNINSIKSPPVGCELWSGTAIHDGARLRWFIQLDGSELKVDKVETVIDRGELRNLAIFYQDPPPGAKETILRAIRASLS